MCRMGSRARRRSSTSYHSSERHAFFFQKSLPAGCIAAYHAPSDSALVLDVARFKYPPYFVSLPLLYESMRAADAATGRPRGYLKVGAAALPAAASAASEGSGVDVVA